MKILVGNNGLANPGGSETYTYALCAELKKQGHEVHAVGAIGPGKVSDNLKKIDIPSFFSPVNGSYDLILLSHSSSIALAKNAKGFKVQTCHGIYPALEQPVKGMDAYVSITEEVYTHLQSRGFNSTIIKNGVDCNRYRPVRPIGEKLKTVLSLAHSDSANTIIRSACNLIGCELIINNKFKEFKWEVDDIINKADLVISLGRGAYESMASGRNVVVFDHRNYMNTPAIGDGFMTIDNVDLFIKNNCSGRYSKKEYDANLLADEILKYNKATGSDLRNYALRNLNIEEQVKKYIGLLK